jgi:hypothetical protein
MIQGLTFANFEIFPFVGVGPLKFGMTRVMVRSLLGDHFEVFQKGFEKNTTDAYDCFNFHLFYDNNDYFDCLTAFGSCPISYKGIALLNVPIQIALKELEKQLLQYRFDDGYFLDKGGFALFESEDLIKGVTVYSKKCFEERISLSRSVPAQ